LRIEDDVDIPDEVIAARDALEGPLIAAGLITGIDFGVRDEDQPDPEDLALRVFVADLNDVPAEVTGALAEFPFPTVVLQRVFLLTATLPDVQRYRPVIGGVSVAASRFLASGAVPTGTLGAIVTDSADSSLFYGLSNHHVLCHDLARQQGDEIVQPEPTPFGSVPGDRVGTLQRWSFPETTPSGPVDAAICLLETDSAPEIADIGPVIGKIAATRGMLVSKRGRTTGRTFGWISGLGGSYPLDFPGFPAVGNPPSTTRTLTNQIQIHIDFPQSIVFGESGDSGSVVIGSDENGFDRVVGLYWGSGSDSAGDPLRFGLASPADAVELALGITF
jgi:hypothetical protein